MLENTPDHVDRPQPLGLESGLEALHASPEFRGPVEPLDGNECNEHFAVIYETPEERFATAIPFVRHGLERGERCMYVVEESTEADVLEAMRAADVDVDAALDSGALTFHTVEETYLRTGTFDPDGMIEFYADAIDDATAEYDALRVTADTTWLLDEGTTIEDFMEYESKVNDLFEGEDCIALCQYDRGRFPADVLCDIVRTHPHLVCDSTVCHNFYYTPPEEFFGPDRPDREADRMLGTLLDRTRAKEALRRRERGLTALTEASRELMGADEGAIDDRAVETTRDVLDVPIAGLWRYDSSLGKLEEPTIRAKIGNEEVVEAMKSIAWEAFVEGKTAVHSHEDAEATFGSHIAVPLGSYGVLVAADGGERAFVEADADLATTLATNVRAALERAEREALLRERERTLEDRNERLGRLNRVNAVIRRIDGALVEATTREEIERAVCECLAGADPYRFAWIAEVDAVADAIDPRAWAGDGDAFSEATIPTREAADGGPTTAALRTGEPQVVHDVLTDRRDSAWRRAAVDAGLHAVYSVPLRYEGTSYGALTVYADRPNAFDELERSVLTELAGTIAHAIDALRSREALVSDAAIELEFRLSDADARPLLLSRRLGCTVEIDGLIPQANGDSLLFFTTDGASASAVRETVIGFDGVEGIRLLAERGERRSFECRLTGTTVFDPIVDRGGAPQRVTADGEELRIVAELPRSADVRGVVERMREAYPDAELAARRERSRPVRTATTFRAALDERLTDRQREVLTAAYLAGFFESPRESTGQEVAASLGISQPTFNTHLRTAERRLFTMLFDGR